MPKPFRRGPVVYDPGLDVERKLMPQEDWWGPDAHGKHHWYPKTLQGRSACSRELWNKTLNNTETVLDNTCPKCWLVHDNMRGTPWQHPEHFKRFRISHEVQEELKVRYNYKFQP
jgi:hypothetical protein